LDRCRFHPHFHSVENQQLRILPGDDAMRHAAKTISGKTWQQILIMRSDFQIDPSPGWQAVLWPGFTRVSAVTLNSW